jgi:deoxyribodipyrimidine photo-lyase
MLSLNLFSLFLGYNDIIEQANTMRNPSFTIPSLGIVWFRKDLRLADNLAWLEACRHEHTHLIPVVVVNPADHTPDPLFFASGLVGISSEANRMGRHRQLFWQQCVADLDRQLAQVGQQLVILHGSPDDALFNLLTSLPLEGQVSLYVNREPGTEEATDALLAKQRLHGLAEWHMLPTGQALYNNLPFQTVPLVFTAFRQQVEQAAQPRLPVETPRHVPPPVANLMNADLTDADNTTRFTGGRSAGLAWLNRFIPERLDKYKATRNELLGDTGGSRLSPWLALGCISSAEVWQAVTQHEAAHGANDGTYWLKFELLWREYFRLLMYDHGGALFTLKGLQPTKAATWSHDKTQFRLWVEGKTGFPLVDAAMRELAATGYTSNRARQNAASFLAKTWRINWTWGARYFEQQLVDYDVASNWGNWAYVAGVGTDPRDRVFNVTKQAKDYDPDGVYVTHWLSLPSY